MITLLLFIINKNINFQKNSHFLSLKKNKIYHDIKKLEHLSAGQKALQLNQLQHRVTQFKLSPQELVSEVAIPRHYRNPDINHINDPIIPEILEELLDTLTQDIEDDHLTDDYSLRQSIQFLLAAKKLNSEGPNYSIGAHSKSKEPEIWIPLLATALVRKECCINPQVELIGTEDWETKLHSFLIKTWALSDTIDLSQHIKTLHPSIQPQQSMAFLQEKSKLPLPNGEWSSTELTIFAGLEICIRTELTRFTIEFTGGVKGRLRDSSGANGQCGSEYSSAGINAILEHKNQPDTPQSLSDWVTRQLYHFRANQLRLVMMPGNQRQNETFFFRRNNENH